MAKVTAFVLAGGKSTRMGTDKAFLEFRGRTLLANALDLVGSCAVEVKIVGSPAKFAHFGTVVEDTYTGRGPLGGIHAALKGSNTDRNIVIGVDLPFVEPRFLEYLLSAAEQSGAVVTVPRIDRHFEPLCAVYRRDFVEPAEAALAAGSNKIDALFADLPVRTVSSDELAQHDFSPAMFRNVNTPEDWKRAQEEFARRQHV